MKFSLILCTLNRVIEVAEFLNSLQTQTFSDFELIIVDQNPDNRIQEILSSSNITYNYLLLKSAPGLSKARNVGLSYASGDVISFPDDDCLYLPHTLEVANSIFMDKEIDGVCGKSISKFPTSQIERKQYIQVSINTVFSAGISYTIFLKKSTCNAIGNFNELLGVGANTPWGAGEESEYLIRALKLGYKIIKVEKLEIYHPNPIPPSFVKAFKKGFNYGNGQGKVLKNQGYSFLFKFYFSIIRPIGGALYSLVKLIPSKSIFYVGLLIGRCRGSVT